MFSALITSAVSLNYFIFCVRTENVLISFSFCFDFRGIGLALCEQLLSSHPGIRICMACRNELRASTAKKILIEKFPDATIDIVIIDTSSIASVLNAADVLKEK